MDNINILDDATRSDGTDRLTLKDFRMSLCAAYCGGFPGCIDTECPVRFMGPKTPLRVLYRDPENVKRASRPR